MKDEEGNIVTGENKIMDSWKRYIQKLLNEYGVVIEKIVQKEEETI